MLKPIFFIALIACTPSSIAAQKTPASDNKAVSGMVLLNDQTPVDFNAIAESVKKDWGIRLDSFSQSGKNLVLYTTSATIRLTNMDYPASIVEIKSAAEGAWMWQAAREEAPLHQSQVIVTVVGAGNRPVQLYKLYTSVVAAVLDNTRACGVYLPGQYLLHSKDFFLQSARSLDQNVLPIYCWIYFGMFQKDGMTCAYTYGLTEFGMPDLEIVQSRHTLQEAHAVLYDIARDALQNNAKLQDGSVIETLEGEKFTLKLSKSLYLEGQQTLQVGY
ncbi:MAG: DUF4261 domain-containing protein [Lewinellaceae bacterium]|nr:DUF4261 domain-containing protein [Lewinellaceae bacterium]